MVKQKEETAKTISLNEHLKQLRKEIGKNYGEGVMVSGEDIVNRKLQNISWCPSLDMICGGVLEGTWISMAGPPKLGKTNILLKLAANMQKVGKHIFVLLPEGRLKKKDLVNVAGLDCSPEKMTVIESTMEKVLSTQDYLTIADQILKTVPGCFMLIDSVSALADEKELHGDIDLQTRGKNYQIISRFVNNLGQYLPPSRSVVAGIIHKIANTSGFGASSSERACNRWKYQADYRFEITHADKWKVGEEIVGLKPHIKCTSSATLTTPYKECVSYVRFGIGLDDLYEIFEYGCACGLIEKAGAWYYMSFLKNHPELNLEKPEEIKALGGDGAWKYLKENPKFAECLKNDVKQFTNDLVKVDNE